MDAAVSPAMARAGARIIIDDAFVSGLDARNRWQATLSDVSVLWVGVSCEPAVAAERERARGDRIAGMATSQAQLVHAGMAYDVEVDTSETSAVECARRIAQLVVENETHMVSLCPTCPASQPRCVERGRTVRGVREVVGGELDDAIRVGR